MAASCLTIAQYLMVDIVVNHNAWAGDASSVDYSTFNPFNSEDDYHTYCTIDYSNDTSIKDCWLGDDNVELPDLCTECDTVASGYQTWISGLVSEFSSKSGFVCFKNAFISYAGEGS